MTEHFTFEDTRAWLRAVSTGHPVAIMPTPMAAEVLSETPSSVSKKLKKGDVPSVEIAGKRHLSADWVHGEVVRIEGQIEDMQAILERVARRGGKIFYGDLMAELHMNSQHPPDRKWTGILLGRISDRSLEEDGIFLSSIVHRKTVEPTHPGPGYRPLVEHLYDVYEDVDYAPGEDETGMVARHMEQVYDHYRNA